jgi:uncharacterized protein YhaN
MRLTELFINGFGIFHEYSLKDIESDLTVAFGSNEAGKSTLLSFIRYTLFGYPDARRKLNSYPPLHGGKHGGQVKCVFRSGEEHTIQRFAGPKGGEVEVISAQGERRGEEALSDLLGRASADLFNNIFAFSLDELQSMESLGNSEIQGRIYSAGLGLGNVSLQDVEEKLRKERDDIFKERSSKPIMNSLAKEIQKKEQEIKDVQKGTHNYDSLVKGKNELTGTINGIKAERQRKNSRLSHLRDLIRAHGNFVELREAEQRIQELPVIDRFPANGIGTLSLLNQKIEDGTKEMRRLQDELGRIEKEKEGLVINRELLDKEAEIEDLKEGKRHYVKASEDLPKRQVDLENVKKDISRSLKDLGTNWNESKTQNFDTSVSTRERIRGFQGDIESSERTADHAKHLLQISKEALTKLTGEKNDAQKQLEGMEEPVEKDRSSIDTKFGLIRRLREILPDYRRIIDSITSFQERLAGSQEMVVPGTRFVWAVPVVFSLVAVIGFMTVSRQVGLFSGVIALLSLFGWLVLRAYWSREHDRHQRTLKGWEKELSVLENQKDETSDMISKLGHELSLVEDPTAVVLEELNAQILKQGECLRDWLDSQKYLETATMKVDEGEKDVELKESEVKKAVVRSDGIRAEWKKWLSENELSENLSPAGALEIVSRIETIMEKMETKKQLQKRIGDVSDTISDYEGKVKRVLPVLSSARTEHDVLAGLVRIISAFGKSRKNSDTEAGLLTEEPKTKVRLSEATTLLKEAAEKLSLLFAEVGTEDEESFRLKSEQYDERVGLLETQNRERISIEKTAGIDEEFTKFIEELRNTPLSELKEEEEVLSEEIGGIDDNIEELRDQKAAKDASIQLLEGPSKLAVRQTEVEGLKQELNDAARQWATLQLALTIIEKATHEYEKERQPKVIQNATSLFATITDSRYPCLRVPIGGTEIQVEDRSGQYKTIDEMSRGSREQLYLALRLGLIEEYERRAEPLPLIMDERQALLFTCHPETVSMLKKHGARVLNLP